MEKIRWARFGGYECSSAGDRRFSALFARLEDGRTIEQHYQCDIKGWQPGGVDWRLGKGRPPKNKTIDLYAEYLKLWKRWAAMNVSAISELRMKARDHRNTLCDRFASTGISQARALADILNEKAS